MKVSKIDPLYLYKTVTQERFKGVGIRLLVRVLETELGDQLLDAQQNGASAVEISLEDELPVVKIAPAASPAAGAARAADNPPPPAART